MPFNAKALMQERVDPIDSTPNENRTTFANDSTPLFGVVSLESVGITSEGLPFALLGGHIVTFAENKDIRSRLACRYPHKDLDYAAPRRTDADFVTL